MVAALLGVFAAGAGAAGLNLGTTPLYLGAQVAPQVMLTVSKDHSLFYKAYNDYTDLTGSGNLDITYNHGVDYFGYFDSYKCYQYSTANSRFTPINWSAKDHTTASNSAANLAAKYCNTGTATAPSGAKATGTWSGNFLNWAGMARVDAMRGVLYGGTRSTDTSTLTVLERAFITTDAHSWSKYYNGADINKLMPFTGIANTPPAAVPASGTSAIPTIAANSSVSVTVNTATALATQLGDQISVVKIPSPTTAPPTIYMYGTVTAITSTTQFAMQVVAGDTLGSGTPGSGWTVTNLSRTGISICNATVGNVGSTNTYSQNMSTVTYPPLMRVVSGNYALWSANERWQCRISSEVSSSNSGNVPGNYANSNGNRALQSQILASAENPNGACSGGVGQCVSGMSGNSDYVARVEACVGVVSGNNLNGEEKCKNYTSGNFKPIGVLQTYGDGNLIQFGLLTGSYDHNISGGVLRKNVSYFSNEVNTGTDGTFTAAAASGIVGNLNKLRAFGYNYASGAGLYNDPSSSGGDSCPFQLTEIVTSGGTSNWSSSAFSSTNFTSNEGGCSSWGNPISEMYLESLRYFAGKSADARFNGLGNNLSSKDATLGLTVATWSDPLSSANYCAPLNVLLFNPATASYDDNSTTSGVANQMDKYSDLLDSQTVDARTKTVGDNEGVTGNNFFVGNNAPGSIVDDCTPKTVSDLSAINGICPEAPALNGSWRMSGAAWYAHMNRIRSAFSSTAPSASDARSLKVTTYGIQLATNTPKITIPIPGAAPQQVVLQPAYRLVKSAGKFGGGGLVDFKVVAQSIANGTGTFYINYDDSSFGGDYDQDVWGRISYCVQNATAVAARAAAGIFPPSGNCPVTNGTSPPNGTITVTTDVIAQSTANPQGWGFIISGTTQDGQHFLSGILGFNYSTTTGTPSGPNFGLGNVPLDSTGVQGCTNCLVTDAGKSWIFTLGTATAGTLQDPLFYAAKWGGFKDLDGDGMPSSGAEFDIRKADGSAGSDGVPDNYFLVTNPNALESALVQTFTAILTTSSASSVATNSTSLNSGTVVYQARFNTNNWSGQLLAFPVLTTGVVDIANPVFDASMLVPSPTSRTIIAYNLGRTNGTDDAIPFRWSNISGLTNTTLKNALNTDPSGVADSTAGAVCTTGFNTPAGCTQKGSLRLDWLRGDPALEGATAGQFRQRPNIPFRNPLGDIVDSTPVYVGKPTKFLFDPTYIAFAKGATVQNRTPMIYAGGNDGMLHGFDASTGTSAGTEKLAYIPSTVFGALTKLTGQSYSHRYYVDGSPTVADAFIDPVAGGSGAQSWNTVLVGGFNAGGQGVYALNVTDPSTFTEANAASILLWEFTDRNDPDLGFTYSQPVIGKMANGKWAAIFGNGYNNSIAQTGETACTGQPSLYVFTPAGCTTSVSGHGVLYIVFIERGTDGVWTAGTDFIKIDTGIGTAASPVGLGSPIAVDYDGDDIIDYVYAGDQSGNLWKFDVTDASSGNWKASFSGSCGLSTPCTPLFVAMDHATPTPNRQTIQDAPAVTIDPSGGMMVYFGTGKYLEIGDDTPSPATPYTQQSFYGIWDQQTKTQTGGTVPTPIRNPSTDALMQQSVLCTGTNNPAGLCTLSQPSVDPVTGAATTVDVRVTTQHKPNYSSSARTNTLSNVVTDVDTVVTTPANQRGWYLDFPNSADTGSPVVPGSGTGERVVFRPLLSSGKLVFATLVPSTLACDAGGTSLTMELDPFTGSRLADSPIDINGDKNINKNDLISFGGVSVAVSAIKSTIGIIPTPTVIPGAAPPAPGGGGGGGTPPAGTCGVGCEIKVISGSSGAIGTIRERAGAPGGARISWRELLVD